MPNLVGNPKTNPSASVRSFGVMIGDSLFGGALILESASSGSVSGTCENSNFIRFNRVHMDLDREQPTSLI